MKTKLILLLFVLSTHWAISQIVTHVVSGTLVYKNSTNPILNGVVLKLMDDTTQIATTTTNAIGAFSFQNVLSGNYTIEASTIIPWGGVSATDALKIKRHVIGLELLTEPIKLTVADVNNSGFITATDALKVQRRVASLDTSFARADWVFEKAATGGNVIIVIDSDVTVSLLGLCTGDVDGSFIPCPIGLNITTTDATCGSATGTASILTVIGGTPPYTYAFNGSAFSSTTTYTDLTPNTYSVSVKDAYGCIYTTSATIADIAAPTVSIIFQTDPSCYGENDGSATALGSGIGGVLTYMWNTIPMQTNITATGLFAGHYTVTVSDINNCTATATVTITEPTPMVLTTTVVSSACGASNGSATVAVTGGILPYSCTWNTNPVQYTPTALNLSVGIYTVTVRDANMCTATSIVNVTNIDGPIALAISSTNSTNGASNGTITIGTVTGGTNPYLYSFDGGVFGTIKTFTGLAADTYNIIVKDANLCEYTKSITINNVVLPTVTTSAISNITTTTATGGGNVTNSSGVAVTARGVCWSTSSNPVVTNYHTANGTGTGSFTSNLTALSASTTYYVRAYATNSAGTGYGNEISFTTSNLIQNIPCPGTPTVTDIDGNTYNTVQIGSQCWMRENLKTTHYSNGIAMVDGTSAGDITYNYTTKYYFDYNNTPTNTAIYGKLYTWAAVMNGAVSSSANPSGVQGVCPTGWHVPSDAEWTQLISNLGESVAGGKMKEAETTHWASPNSGADNSSGFTGLPGGERNHNGSCNYLGYYGYWWSGSETNASDTWVRLLTYGSISVSSGSNDKASGCSVRCLRDF